MVLYSVLPFVYSAIEEVACAKKKIHLKVHRHVRETSITFAWNCLWKSIEARRVGGTASPNAVLHGLPRQCRKMCNTASPNAVLHGLPSPLKKPLHGVGYHSAELFTTGIPIRR